MANTEHSKTSVYVESMFWSADEQCEDTVTISYQAIKLLPPEPKAPNEAGQHCLITRAFESLRSYVFICSLDARKRNRDCTMQSHVFMKFKSFCSPGTSRFEIIVSEFPLVIQSHSDAVPGKKHRRCNTSEPCGSACGFVLWGQVSGGSGPWLLRDLVSAYVLHVCCCHAVACCTSGSSCGSGSGCEFQPPMATQRLMCGGWELWLLHSGFSYPIIGVNPSHPLNLVAWV